MQSHKLFPSQRFARSKVVRLESRLHVAPLTSLPLHVWGWQSTPGGRETPVLPTMSRKAASLWRSPEPKESEQWAMHGNRSDTVSRVD